MRSVKFLEKGPNVLLLKRTAKKKLYTKPHLKFASVINIKQLYDSCGRICYLIPGILMSSYSRPFKISSYSGNFKCRLIPGHLKCCMFQDIFKCRLISGHQEAVNFLSSLRGQITFELQVK